MLPFAITCPETRYDARIGRRGGDELVFEPRRDCMPDQHDREPQAERYSEQLQGWQTKRPALVHGHDSQRHVERRRAIQDDRNQRVVPKLDSTAEHDLCGVERDEAQRMIGEMRREITEHHDPGYHAQVAMTNAPL